MVNIWLLYVVVNMWLIWEKKNVSWDDDIPDIWTNKIHVRNHQSDICLLVPSNEMFEYHR